MFITDLPQNIESGCLLCADDVKNFRKITSPADGQALQRDLSRLSAWSVSWGLTLNPTKCKSLTLTMTLRRPPVQTKYFIAGTELEHVDEIRDLGVTIDSKLTFAPHVSDISGGLTGRLASSFVPSRSVPAERNSTVARC